MTFFLYLGGYTQYLFIDESGTMTKEYANHFPFFVICVINVFDRDQLKRVLKRFIQKNMDKLKLSDKENKMFKNGKFLELKGNALSQQLKFSLVEFLSKSNLFEVFYIIIDNSKVDNKLYLNKARAFNYILDIFMKHHLKKGRLPKDNYYIQIDERNVKNDAKKSLEDYLNTSLSLDHDLTNDISVIYQDSCNNSLIQLSDFFANLFYSYLMNEKVYKETINELTKKGIIRPYFKFPPNKRK